MVLAPRAPPADVAVKDCLSSTAFELKKLLVSHDAWRLSGDHA